MYVNRSRFNGGSIILTKFNKKRFIKYKLFPLVIFCQALILTTLFIVVILQTKYIPIELELVIILVTIMTWAVALDSNIDAQGKEIRDILNKRLPESQQGELQ